MTPFSSRCYILSELWMDYRHDENFEDFVDYNDIGLPLAYMIEQELVTASEQGNKYVNETFDLLLEALGVDDTGWEGLDQLLEAIGYEGT